MIEASTEPFSFESLSGDRPNAISNSTQGVCFDPFSGGCHTQPLAIAKLVSLENLWESRLTAPTIATFDRAILDPLLPLTQPYLS